MIAGRLQEKNGYFYVVLSYKDSTGKRKEPWISTGLTVKGNKRQAQKLLEEYRLNFDTTTGKLQVQTSQKAENTPATVLNKKTLFGDYAHFEEEEHLISAGRIAKALQPDSDNPDERSLPAPKGKSDFEM